MWKALVFLITVLSTGVFGQCPDSLKSINFPCCISGMDWSEPEKTLYLVSDLENKVFKARIDFKEKTAEVFDSIHIINPHHNRHTQLCYLRSIIVVLFYNSTL